MTGRSRPPDRRRTASAPHRRRSGWSVPRWPAPAACRRQPPYAARRAPTRRQGRAAHVVARRGRPQRGQQVPARHRMSPASAPEPDCPARMSNPPSAWRITQSRKARLPASTAEICAGISPSWISTLARPRSPSTSSTRRPLAGERMRQGDREPGLADASFAGGDGDRSSRPSAVRRRERRGIAEVQCRHMAGTNHAADPMGAWPRQSCGEKGRRQRNQPVGGARPDARPPSMQAGRHAAAARMPPRSGGHDRGGWRPAGSRRLRRRRRQVRPPPPDGGRRASTRATVASAVAARATGPPARLVQRVDARRIHEHRGAGLAAGEGTAERDRMARHHQFDPQQAGERGELLDRAGPLPVGGDDQRHMPGDHKSRRQPRHRQRLPGTGRPREKHRTAVGRQRHGAKVRVPPSAASKAPRPSAVRNAGGTS